ncbi:MAG: alpha-L-fucosidase [Spirochaetales bacterium]
MKPTKALAELQKDLMNLRFGMFIHFSPATFLKVADRLQPDHAPPRQGKDGVAGTADDLSPALFHPTKLDCDQWAEAAVSAGMKFGVLTTKHHDGFCLWPSERSDYTVAQGFGRDVVHEFSQAFRKRGLKVGFYYSIRDRTVGIADKAHGGVTRAHVQLIKDQLTELLTDYGPVLYLVFDAWGNDWHESPTYEDLSYAEIYHHIKGLQPDCLVLNHTTDPTVCDVLQLELAAQMKLPDGADLPAVGGDCLQQAWFWAPDYPATPVKSLDWIVEKYLKAFNRRSAVFQLNCAPNPEGLLDDNVLRRLAEVGKAWAPPPPLAEAPAAWSRWPVPPKSEA